MSSDSTTLKSVRKIPKVPFKVLDAPSLEDDFYLNLVDWSSTNILAVGLGTAVYIWSASSQRVSKLCEVPETDAITSVGKGCFATDCRLKVIAKSCSSSQKMTCCV